MFLRLHVPTYVAFVTTKCFNRIISCWSKELLLQTLKESVTWVLLNLYVSPCSFALLPYWFTADTLGTTGNITFNENGDRVGYYDIFNFHHLTDTKTVGLYNPGSDSIRTTLRKRNNFWWVNLLPSPTPLCFLEDLREFPSTMMVHYIHYSFEITYLLVCVCVQGVCVNNTCKCNPGYSGLHCDGKFIVSLFHSVNANFRACCRPRFIN